MLTGLNRTSATTENIASTNVAAQYLRTTTLGISGLSVTGNTSSKFTQATGLTFAVGDTVSITAKNANGVNIKHVFEITDGSAALSTVMTDTTVDVAYS